MSMTRLDHSVFEIDIPVYIDKLTGFIRAKMEEMGRVGILVPFSGGLDSSTVLLLCIQAVGKDRVRALLLPEKQGNPEAEYFAKRLAGQHQIETITHNITPILDQLGVYEFALARIPSRAIQEKAVGAYFKVTGANPYLEIKYGRAGALERKGFSLYNTKHRVRAVVTFQLAEELNYMVAGCAHKSEDMLGLFVKFGVDDNADIMPLKNLYRSQFLQMADRLGIPAEIQKRTPNPDIIPGISDKYMDILGLPASTLDLMLYGLEHGLADEEIAAQLDLSTGKVQEIRDLVAMTQHMRNPSQSLTW